jgi:hypothetical protein
MTPEPDVRLEHARWLLDRSDHLRSSYANRAALVLGIDAGILGALFAVLGLARPSLADLVAALLATALVFTFTSVIFAFLASSTLRGSSRAATKSDSGRRLFLGADDTFHELGLKFADFKSNFENSSVDLFVEHVLCELHVALQLQNQRYRYLKASIVALFGAMVTLLALALALLTR